MNDDSTVDEVSTTVGRMTHTDTNDEVSTTVGRKTHTDTNKVEIEMV